MQGAGEAAQLRAGSRGAVGGAPVPGEGAAARREPGAAPARRRAGHCAGGALRPRADHALAGTNNAYM